MLRCALRCIPLALLLVAPSAATSAPTQFVAVPNVVHLEITNGLNRLVAVGVGSISRYTINCPNLHSGKSLRIAYQMPAAGARAQSGFAMEIIVARQGTPKAHRSELLPARLTRAGLCAAVSR